MTIHRFFIESQTIQENQAVLDGETAWQISKVLRLKPEDNIILLDNSQTEYYVQLTTVTPKQVLGKILGQKANQAEPKQQIHLYQALLPREKFEFVLQKGTEVGISSFTPITTERTLPKEQNKQERWQKIIKEAAEQSERGRLPSLNPALTFEQAVVTAHQQGSVLIAWEEDTTSLEKMTIKFDQQPISIFIGPEGGFSELEIEKVRKLGAETINLGKRILRSETAGLVLATLLLQKAGEFN